jgi:DNA polymerase-3 subunit alpha
MGGPMVTERTSERERGSAAVWVLAGGLVVILFAMAMVTLGTAVAARHQAQLAADLAALAGAVVAVEGEPAACVEARRVAEENRATVAACQLEGFDVIVRVHVAVPLIGDVTGTASAAARAGPEDPTPAPERMRSHVALTDASRFITSEGAASLGTLHGRSLRWAGSGLCVGLGVAAVTAGSFVHLHVHTEYSMLDGAAQLKPLFAEAARLEMPALGMTDHGNMFGAYAFFQQAKAAGIKPILGIEAYVAPDSRFTKKPIFWGTPADRERGDDISGSGAYLHMTMLAENATGLRNLFKLSSLASIDGYYYKPRMDRELLARYSEGIIATTGCPSGEVQTRLRLGHDAAAREAAGQLRDIFGPDNFFLELMDHGLDIERRVREGLVGIGRELGLRPLATNDSHYVRREDASAHEALLCVQSGKTLDDPKRFKFDGDGYYLQSAPEMRATWDAEVPGACDSTLLVAERIQPYDQVFAEVSRMPLFPVPEGETQESWLRRETWAGMARRFPQGIPEEHRQRAEYELGVIEQMGFCAYFLVVADLCAYARTNSIRVGPGRGSATGCIVAYALGITELDPIEHRLLFERFLNPDRVSMPDIDLDFDERRRGEMIRYVTERWGEDRVSQIITFGTIKAKAALKDAARILYGQPGFSMADRISKAMPPAVMGKDIPLSGIIDPSHPRYGEAAEVRTLLDTDPTVSKIFETARGLEGLIRQPGVHAAGVILSAEPLLDVLPVWRRDDGSIITGWDYPSCEAVGLLKMDFLGLRNLTVLDDAVVNIKANRGIDVDLDSLPLADDATFELLSRGDTLGVFQLDGGPMRSLLKAMAPTKFEDIAAVLALYRPGPMAANAHIDYADRKNGRKPVVPIHPELAEPLADILDETYGLIVYQEQVMAIAQRVAGYSLGNADLLRRAMGKKKKEILDKEYVGFHRGMSDNGYSDDAIKTLWEILLPFAGYAFNKSHTAGYGIVSFWTAYLKANFPAEYMAALLTSVGDDKDKSAIYLAECRKMGIKVLPPDINESAHTFTPTGTDIRFGLGAVRNVGANVVQSVVRTRRAKGKYTSFEDFLRKSELVVCNKRVIESLIKAGAFDSAGHTRRGLMSVHDLAVDQFTSQKREEVNGQFTLWEGFGDDAADTPTEMVIGVDLSGTAEEWQRKTLLGFEREMLGLYVSTHPLAGAERVLRRHAEHQIAAINEGELPDGSMVVIAGLVSGVQRRITKEGKVWAIATVEDLDASVEVLFFPKSYEVFGEQLAEDTVVAVRGRVNQRDNGNSVVGMDLAVLDISDVDLDAHPPVVIVLPVERITADLVGELKNSLSRHQGERPVRLKVRGMRTATMYALGSEFRVSTSGSLIGELKALLGSGCLE